MTTTTDPAPETGIDRRYLPIAVLAWLWVGVPFGYGVYQLLTKVVQLFSG